MKHITFYLDFISPYAYLAFEELPRALEGLGYSVTYKPVMFAAHPFNPLGLLRLAVAMDAAGTPNRYVCETVFRHVWQGGADAADTARLAQLAGVLKPQQDPNSEPVKACLKANADAAIADGVFGVPTFVVDGKLFWGLDALPMLRDYLQGGSWFAQSHWDRMNALPWGVPARKP